MLVDQEQGMGRDSLDLEIVQNDEDLVENVEDLVAHDEDLVEHETPAISSINTNRKNM